MRQDCPAELGFLVCSLKLFSHLLLLFAWFLTADIAPLQVAIWIKEPSLGIELDNFSTA